MDENKPITLEILEAAVAKLGPRPDLLLEVWAHPARVLNLKVARPISSLAGPRFYERPSWPANATVFIYQDRIVMGLNYIPCKGIGNRAAWSVGEVEKLLDSIVTAALR